MAATRLPTTNVGQNGSPPTSPPFRGGLVTLHGVNDSRVPVSQARLFRDRLEALGYEAGEDGDFEYHELGEEGHASSDIDQKERMFRLLVDFLDRRVGGE